MAVTTARNSEGTRLRGSRAANYSAGFGRHGLNLSSAASFDGHYVFVTANHVES